MQSSSASSCIDLAQHFLKSQIHAPTIPPSHFGSDDRRHQSHKRPRRSRRVGPPELFRRFARNRGLRLRGGFGALAANALPLRLEISPPSRPALLAGRPRPSREGILDALAVRNTTSGKSTPSAPTTKSKSSRPTKNTRAPTFLFPKRPLRTRSCKRVSL